MSSEQPEFEGSFLCISNVSGLLLHSFGPVPCVIYCRFIYKQPLGFWIFFIYELGTVLMNSFIKLSSSVI